MTWYKTMSKDPLTPLLSCVLTLPFCGVLSFTLLGKRSSVFAGICFSVSEQHYLKSYEKCIADSNDVLWTGP